MAYAMTSVGRIIKLAGGPRAVVSKLGDPITAWSLISWGRNKLIPERYHEVLSAMSGVPIDEFATARKGRPRSYSTSYAYRLMCEGLKIKVKKASQIHRVSMDHVRTWMSGREEVPLQSFIDLYYYASSRPVPGMSLTVDEAVKLTGMSQNKMCDVLGLNRSAASRWRALGYIPSRHVDTLMNAVSGLNRRKELTVE